MRAKQTWLWLALVTAAVGGPAGAQNLFITDDGAYSGDYVSVVVGRDETGVVFTSPNVQFDGGTVSDTFSTHNASRTEIRDGTFNTIIADDTSEVTLRGNTVAVGDAVARGNSTISIIDGTSNTLLVEESAVGRFLGGFVDDAVIVRGNGSLDIRDGTANTLFLGDGAVTFIRGGIVTGGIEATGNSVLEIQDGTSNTLLLRENSTLNLRGGDLGGTIYGLGNTRLNLYAYWYTLANPIAGSFGVWEGTFYDLSAGFGDRVLSGRYFAAWTDGDRRYDPQFHFVAIPEPGALSLFAGGLPAIGLLLRRRRGR